MKSYTNLKQSQELAKILPVESADMSYHYDIATAIPYNLATCTSTPCWSLGALLNILSNKAYSIDKDACVTLSSYKTVEWDLGIDNTDLELITESNPIDACYEMIIKLHEQKLL